MTAPRKVYAAWFAALSLLAGTARAQDDVAIMGNSVQPNVMILFDNSGSMAHAMWSTTFNQKLFYDSLAIYNNPAKQCNTGTNNLGTVAERANSWGLCPGGGDDDGDSNLNECPDSDGDFLAPGAKFLCLNVPNGCLAKPAGWTCTVGSGGKYTFTLPDISAGGTTRWSRNYLHWIVNQMYSTGAPPVMPATDRMGTAQTAIIAMIDHVNPTGFPDNVRFGLGKFEGSAKGGVVESPIANANKATLTTKINGLQPQTNTPLAEASVSMAQYLTGKANVGNCSGSSTIQSGNPMQDWCRRTFLVIVTDGEPTDDDFSDMPGAKAGFVCAIGNADGDLNEQDETHTYPALCPISSDCPTAGRTDRPPYTNLGTDWLDDVTTYCYQHDLRPDLPNTQNIITYTVGLLIDHPLLKSAAEKTTGKYFVANSAQQLADTLSNSILDILERATGFSSPSVPSSRTAFSDGLFAASFVPHPNAKFWEGHLEAYRIAPDLTVLDVNNNPAIDATGTFIEPKHPFWDSAEAMLTQGARTLYTNIAGVRTDFTTANTTYATFGIEAGTPSPEWNTYPYLLTGPSKSAEQVADDLVSYLYGADAFDEDRDSNSTELRPHILGDLFHSNPIVIGPPPFALNGEAGYGPLGTSGTFLETYKHRARRLFVGGNDGMLHSIDVGTFQTGNNPLTPETETEYYNLGTGREVFGWVPGSLLDTVKYVPRNYPRTYYYADGSPSVADVWLPSSAADTSKNASEWTTLLVEGMRQGGRSYLALDVTDPSAVSSGAHGPYPVFKWNFNDPSQPMGQTWSEPVITRVKLRAAPSTGDKCGPSNGDGDCLERWVVIVSGGFDNTADPNLAGYISDPASASWTEYGKAVFVLDAKTGAVLAKLRRVAADAQLSKMKFAIPSTPAVLDLDFDGFADVVYVGDTAGQVWKWVIHGVGVDSNADGLIDNWPYGRFFDAGHVTLTSGTEHYRSIFSPPSAAFVGLDQRLVLAFGTGERTSLNYVGDPAKDDENRLYVIQDPHPLDASAIPSSPYTESNLTDITSVATDTDQTDLGYFIKAAEGEKFVTSNIILAGNLITASYTPPPATGPICERSGKSYAWITGLEQGVGQQTDPSADAQARRLYAAVGVPSDPRVSISPETGDAQVFLKGSSGQMLSLDGPNIGGDPVELVYWRQRF